MKHIMPVTVISFLVLCFAASLPTHAGYQDLVKGAMKSIEGGGGGSLTDGDIVQGLKEALQIGTSNSVEIVSQADGYYKNPQIKIPLPGNLQKVEKILKTTGFGQQVDEFELSMNRAAERAAPQAKPIFLDAIKQMSFDDARKILNGRDNEATLYFEDKTSAHLREIFKPITHQAMSEVGVTSQYQALDAKVKTIPFAGEKSFDLDQYVTDKALNGLFIMLGEEEKKIRENPTAQVTDLLKKVFGRK